MHTIIGSSRRDCVLIILLHLYGFSAGLFEGDLFWGGGGGGGSQYDPPQPPYWNKN